jgi:hypothetical protein
MYASPARPWVDRSDRPPRRPRPRGAARARERGVKAGARGALRAPATQDLEEDSACALPGADAGRGGVAAGVPMDT